MSPSFVAKNEYAFQNHSNSNILNSVTNSTLSKNGTQNKK